MNEHPAQADLAERTEKACDDECDEGQTKKCGDSVEHNVRLPVDLDTGSPHWGALVVVCVSSNGFVVPEAEVDPDPDIHSNCRDERAEKDYDEENDEVWTTKSGRLSVDDEV